MKSKTITVKLIILTMLLGLVFKLEGKEYHVSKSGDDQNEGTAASPFQTIQAAADMAQPGDIITVHEGIYRERVNPPRGGTSDAERIVYRAAKGEKAEIKGSEIVKGWARDRDDVWRVTLPNTVFGDYNPFTEPNKGEWYLTPVDGYDRHTASVYLNGDWLTEARDLETVLAPPGNEPLWFASVDDTQTTIWAQFTGNDPNRELVEINIRKSAFYPDSPGCNYITVTGFTMRQTATPWSGAMSQQLGVIGTHWSKGWVIENNVISHCMNTGITLGHFDLGALGMAMPEATALGYIEDIKIALEHGWSKETIGSHIIRNNHISHCEKNGIHGSLGGIFSIIEGNTIHHIAVRGWVNGNDTGGIKLLGSNDVVIRNNHIYRCGNRENKAGLGLWLDWMAHGTRVSGNLFHDNKRDCFIEVNHGPYLFDNNLFLSRNALLDASQGGVFVHNLFAGEVRAVAFLGNNRRTPFQKPHSTEVVGYEEIFGGDTRFMNNIVIGYRGLTSYKDAELPMLVDGNVYLKGAGLFGDEAGHLLLEYDPEVALEESEGALFLSIHVDPQILEMKNQLVETRLLGEAVIPKQAFTHPDRSDLKIDKDHVGKKRDSKNPVAGPFEKMEKGSNRLKVWN